MFEYSIQLSFSEKAILNDALNNAELANNFEKKKEEEKALLHYKKAIDLLEKTIKSLSSEKQSIFFTLLESYKERINIIESFQRRKSFSAVDDTFLYTHKLLNNSHNVDLKYPQDSKLNLNNSKKNKKTTKNKSEDINFFINLRLDNHEMNEKSKNHTIEDALNVLDELERIQLIFKILEKTMIYGGSLTKNLYIPSYVWQIEINDLVIEEIEKIKIKYFKTIADEISILLYDENNLHKIKKELIFLKSNLIKLYKEEKFQNLLNVSKTKKTFFENYKDIIKKNFIKLNLYITSASNKNNYNEMALLAIQNGKKLVEILRKISKIKEENDAEFKKNTKFFYLFFKDVLIKIFIADLELRLNQYLVLIRKNIIEK